MLPAIGIIVVFAAILYGFRLEGGNFSALLQPGEVLIICGSAVGTLIAANPAALLRSTARDVVRVFGKRRLTSESYLITLTMLHSVFEFGRRNGVAKLEVQLENPEKGLLFRQYSGLFESTGAFDFLRDTLLLICLGQAPAAELDEMLERDIENIRVVMAARAGVLTLLADALPGFGIVSAVLGVVITMGSLNGSPLEVGAKVSVALLGTFMGIALSYGLVGPLAANIGAAGLDKVQYYESLRAGLTAYARGAPTSIAVEFARRAIPPSMRPDFSAMEAAWKPVSAPNVVVMPPPAA